MAELYASLLVVSGMFLLVALILWLTHNSTESLIMLVCGLFFLAGAAASFWLTKPKKKAQHQKAPDLTFRDLQFDDNSDELMRAVWLAAQQKMQEATQRAKEKSEREFQQIVQRDNQ
ncbi:hypothetical protein [Asticcacaulis sp.]|uniref:hypothetical protein n=1 Tax=Asticcacaulis sp. TaxID=1872648 RepID=UPI002639B6C4|nr:hypothetical protein [Asticcacaulis sp.]